jgi:transcriptional regulator GlxA family with amidase domain
MTAAVPGERVRVGVLLFDGCDVLDVTGTIEPLLVADRLAGRTGDPARFDLVTMGAAGTGPVTGYGGLRVLPDVVASDVRHLDVLVVPGMVDIEAAVSDADLVATVATLAADAALVTSVCTGSFLLAAAGLVGDRPVTTHHEDLDALRATASVGDVVAGVRWVDDGDLVTGAGIASALAFGLHLVDRVAGRTAAIATARQLEHPWDPDGRDGVLPSA